MVIFVDVTVFTKLLVGVVLLARVVVLTADASNPYLRQRL